jgi:thioester reductase-like protein/pimeloyl-ACP methyl ester carboxylesterase
MLTKTALFTGANGFLGSHVLLGFLLRTDARAICLGRSDKSLMLKSKIERALETAAASYKHPPQIDSLLDRIEAIEVDFAQPLLGLKDAQVEMIRQEGCGDFWHFAACLKFLEEDRAEIIDVNVGGAARMLELNEAIGADRLIYISTAYVNGSRRCAVANEPNTTGVFNNVYEESKQAAEFKVVESGKSYLIFRPSIVIGNSETFSTAGARTGFYRLVHELSRVSKMAANQDCRVRVEISSESVMNLIPVNQFANDCLAVVLEGAQPEETIFNVTASHPYSLAELETFMPDVGIANVDLVETLDDPTPLEQVLEKRTRFFRRYLQNEKLRIVRTIKWPADVTIEQLKIFTSNALNGSAFRTFAKERELSDAAWSSILVQALSKGRPESVAVVNAYGMPLDFWEKIAARLTPTYNVYLCDYKKIDCATVGRSEFLQDAESVANFVNSLGQKTHILSWCSGSGLALTASTMIDNCGACVHFGGGYTLRDRDFAKTDYARITRQLYRRVAGNSRVARVTYESMFKNLKNNRDPGEAEQKKQISFIISCMDPRYLDWATAMFDSFEQFQSFALKLDSLNDFEIDDYLTRTKSPSLFLVGDQDRNVDLRVSRLVASRVENGRYLELTGADHWSLHNDARVWNEIETFIRRAAI